ncbi:isoprenoid biosynthesis glyoxalase ElbB [candidate division KSB1 bacterium]|nr:isoprenoid biosynthesis glyoxalase ElbB [candidate division KSB1 bacterium]MBL7102880.1 isoprenoid biosynthesis glyoxalase ElbB [Bacteroidales bacterium]
MKKFAVILSGCGVFDGAEIHEATLTMLAIKKQGAEYEIFAPDIPQHHVINHITGEEMNEIRNVLVESARIARGNIKDLKEYNPSDFDALIFPGGFGAAKNLCDFAFKGPDCTINDDVVNAIQKTAEQHKPIGALCISPVFMAKIFRDVEVTIGQDAGTAEAIEKMGATHKQTDHGEVIVDEKNLVFTTPCYMLDANILQIAKGASNIVEAMMERM